MTTLYDYEALQKENDALKKHLKELINLALEEQEWEELVWDYMVENYFVIRDASKYKWFINKEMFE